MVVPKVVKKLKVTKIPIVETYDLVDWPDNCPLVPTFYQIQSTLAILEIYDESPKSFKGELKAKIEKWFKTNSIDKFKIAFIKAELEQEHLDNLKQSVIDDECEYSRRRWRRQDN